MKNFNFKFVVSFFYFRDSSFFILFCFLLFLSIFIGWIWLIFRCYRIHFLFFAEYCLAQMASIDNIFAYAFFFRSLYCYVKWPYSKCTLYYAIVFWLFVRPLNSWLFAYFCKYTKKKPGITWCNLLKMAKRDPLLTVTAATIFIIRSMHRFESYSQNNIWVNTFRWQREKHSIHRSIKTIWYKILFSVTSDFMRCQRTKSGEKESER